MRLLSDPLPLRRGSDIQGMAADAVLPWVYGRVTLAPLPMDDQGLEWLIADHPIVAVSSVRDTAGELDGWELVQRLQAPGQAIAALRLTRAPEGALVADATGKQDPITGALIEHPAAICADLLRTAGGASGAWEDLRTAWPGLRLGGVLGQAQTLRQALGAVIDSIGAAWSGWPLRAWMPGTGAVVASLAAADIDDASADAATEGLATRLRLAWGQDWAAGAPLGTLTLANEEAAATYGTLEAEHAAPWLTTERDAQTVAAALLSRRAHPTWDIALALGPGDLWRPGDRLTLSHPWIPAGTAELLSITRTAAGRDVRCVL